jgi:solute:Na+ symporter, SSS family
MRVSSIGVADYYSRFKKGATDKQKLRTGKVFVVLSGLGALGVATIYVIGGEGVSRIVFTLYASVLIIN